MSHVVCLMSVMSLECPYDSLLKAVEDISELFPFNPLQEPSLEISWVRGFPPCPLCALNHTCGNSNSAPLDIPCDLTHHRYCWTILWLSLDLCHPWICASIFSNDPHTTFPLLGHLSSELLPSLQPWTALAWGGHGYAHRHAWCLDKVVSSTRQTRRGGGGTLSCLKVS